MPQATAGEMAAERIPLIFRDHCAHLLIPLNRCRVDTFAAPWKCGDLRHAYEACQYEEFKMRCREKKAALSDAAAAAAKAKAAQSLRKVA